MTTPSADGARSASAGRAPSADSDVTAATDGTDAMDATDSTPDPAGEQTTPTTQTAQTAPTTPATPVTPVTQTEDGQPLLRLSNVGKNFGPVRVLMDINLDIPPGLVTAVVGDNGAGKSTLIKTISGIYQPDGGEIRWQGRQVHLHSPKDATDLGIATVYQDLALCDNLDIVANMFLGREETKFGQLDEVGMEKTAKQTLADLSVVTVRSVRQPVGSLSGGQRQAVAVARAVMRQARLVILDEPTAALGVTQTRVVLDLIRRLKSQNIAVIVISHNLNDVQSVADRIAVLRLGRLVAVGPAAQYDAESIVDLMTTGTSKRLAAVPAEQSGSSSEH